MARMTKAAKVIEDQVEAAFKRHANCVQINIMDLSNVMNAGRKAIMAGQSLDEAMMAAVAKYRQN